MNISGGSESNRIHPWDSLFSTLPYFFLTNVQIMMGMKVTVCLDDTHSSQEFSECELDSLTAWAFRRRFNALRGSLHAMRRRFVGISWAFRGRLVDSVWAFPRNEGK